MTTAEGVENLRDRHSIACLSLIEWLVARICVDTSVQLTAHAKFLPTGNSATRRSPNALMRLVMFNNE